MKFKGTIIITDPCYILKEDTQDSDWNSCNYGENMEALGLKNYISEPTIFGDWSCATYCVGDSDPLSKLEELETLESDAYNIDNDEDASSEEVEEVYKALAEASSELSSIGEFSADAGMVAVLSLDEVLKYNPDFDSWISEHPWCVTVIKDFDGEVDYVVTEGEYAHIIGRGNINFFTSLTVY